MKQPENKILGVIPARYPSVRFPGKPLADVAGKSMIQRVYQQALKAKWLNRVVVATDDKRIYDHVKGFGGHVVMTSATHKTGTERCAEVSAMPAMKEYNVVINIQGDEPLIDPGQIDLLAAIFLNHSPEIATLVRPVSNHSDLSNPNIVKVVIAQNGDALYFSRSPIPYIRPDLDPERLKNLVRYHHIGIYGYTQSALQKIAALEPSPCEIAESLEQLRWLENGFRIATDVSTHISYSIDTPDDLVKVNELLKQHPDS